MKTAFRAASLSLLFLASALGPAGCDAAGVEPASLDVVMVQREVAASCGQCQLGIPGSGCTLGIRFDGQGYYVDGRDIDDRERFEAANRAVLHVCVHRGQQAGRDDDVEATVGALHDL